VCQRPSTSGLKIILNFLAICKVAILKVQRDVDEKTNKRDVSVADTKEMKIFSTQLYDRRSMLTN